jgi:hypothetical protein
MRPSGSCVIEETIMKRLLIIPGIALLLLLAACAAATRLTSSVTTQTGTGLVQGKFVMEGGPIGPGGQQPGERPISGLVTFNGGPGDVIHFRVDRSGAFSIRLPDGTYAVTGRSPSVIQVSNGGVVSASGQVVKGSQSEPACSPPLSVTVTPQHTSHLTLTCTVP